MSSVWYCIPSKKTAAEAQKCVDLWRSMGYSVALWRDIGDDLVDCDYIRYGEYPGYAKAVNALAKDVLAYDTACNWIVTGGDDTEPEPNKRADVIAAECNEHFNGTYGVMQPTGDRWGGERGGSAYIDRIAGSPWLGREWCLRAHKGAGPLHPDFFHMFVDEALLHAAASQGVFWQRRDLTHYHRHWAREKGNGGVPWYLKTANGQSHWNEAKAIFERIKRGGFAECLPA